MVMPERMTAKKVRIVDIANGEWVQQDGMEPSYVISKTKERVSRARILATIVSKFLSEDGNFGSLTIDDGTDTIRAKCFKDMTPIDKADIGQLVDTIGKVREYNSEIYVMPEVVKQISDPNILLLRKLEIAKRMKELQASDGEAPAGNQQQPVDGKAGTTESTSSASTVNGQEDTQEATPSSNKDSLREKVLGIIDASKDGIEYAALIEKTGQPEDKVDSVVNELLSEGICYEPTPGKVRKI